MCESSGELEMCGMGRRDVRDGKAGIRWEEGEYGNRRCLVLMLIGRWERSLSLAGNKKRRLVFG